MEARMVSIASACRLFLVPAALVVDHEESRDVREDIDEGAHVARIGGKAGLGLEDLAHSA